MLILSTGSIFQICLSPKAERTLGAQAMSLFGLKMILGVDTGERFWGKNFYVVDLKSLFYVWGN